MSKNPLDIALHFLKFRARSVFEIEKKLKEKKVEEKEIKKTIAVLKRNDLLDDKKFAMMYVRDRNRFKPTGSYVLQLELKRLGLSQTDIESAMEGQHEDVAQETLARQAIESKHRYREADFPKQASFLQRRGFSMSVIMKVLKK